MELTISIEGLADVEKMIKAKQAEAIDILREEIRNTCIDTAADAREAAPVDTGDMQNKTGWHVEDGGLTGIIESKKEYADYVDKDTRPHFPPPSALAGWVRRHGMPPGAAWAIAKTIAKRGTKARPFMTNAWNKHAGALAENVRRRLSKLFD